MIYSINNGGSQSPSAPLFAIATISALPGRQHVLREHLSWYAQQIASEPGTLVFTVFVDYDRSETFTVLEVYADSESLEVHASSAARKELDRRLNSLTASHELRWLNLVAGHGLHRGSRL